MLVRVHLLTIMLGCGRNDSSRKQAMQSSSRINDRISRGKPPKVSKSDVLVNHSSLCCTQHMISLEESEEERLISTKFFL